jgi:hypothetical protein
MIDNQAQAKALMRKMEAHLPIPARPTDVLIRLMKPHGASLTRDQPLSIKAVFYLGDEGGILCDVTVPGQVAMVCSVTQVEISSDHPLAGEIRAYQEERTRKIAQTNREAGSIFMPPESDLHSRGDVRWDRAKSGRSIRPARRKRRRR